MTRLMLALALALCACAPEPAETPVPASDVQVAPPAITGAFAAMSTTAMGVTGDLDSTPDVLSFSKGFRIEGGRIDAALSARDEMFVGGGTYADATGNSSIAEMELRRIETVRIAADARDPQLCGTEAATHVVLARGAETLSVLVFSGADAPGANATNVQLCGIYNFMPG
jgi:hypothetical protein